MISDYILHCANDPFGFPIEQKFSNKFYPFRQNKLTKFLSRWLSKIQVSRKCSSMNLSKSHAVMFSPLFLTNYARFFRWRMDGNAGEINIFWCHPKWFGSHSDLIDKKRSSLVNLWIVYFHKSILLLKKTTKRKFLARQAFNNGTKQRRKNKTRHKNNQW